MIAVAITSFVLGVLATVFGAKYLLFPAVARWFYGDK